MDWNEYMDVFTFIKTFFGFTRNKQIGCLEAFRGNANGAKHTRARLQVMSALLGMFREKI